jgi:hypothetical protein
MLFDSDKLLEAQRGWGKGTGKDFSRYQKLGQSISAKVIARRENWVRHGLICSFMHSSKYAPVRDIVNGSRQGVKRKTLGSDKPAHSFEC